MRSALLGILAILAFCACKSPAPDYEKTKVNTFSNKLFALLRARDSSGYTKLLPRHGDQWLNVNTGQASEMPVNEEALSRKPDELTAEFNAAIEAIAKIIGPVSGAVLLSTEYSIDEDPSAKRLGILKFDITLNLTGGGKTVHVLQRECVVSLRGVLIANGLSVREQ
jgi:hypothetical protein